MALVIPAMAVGQELSIPPTSTLDEPTTAPPVDDGTLTMEAEVVETPEAEPTTTLPEAGYIPGPSYQSLTELEQCNTNMWGSGPALLESTGTWLRRGWWYTEIDAVVLNRMWKRDDLVLGGDTSSTRNLRLNRTDPGADGNARLTIGRFLFRDIRNRDHTLEFTAYGGADSSQDDTLSSSTDGQTLVVPTGISDFNPGFDGSQTMSVFYDSHFKTFELNYCVKERLQRDRMVLLPNGEWVRKANSGVTRQFLAGIRYLDLTEHLDWMATNISSQGNEDGSYNIYTNNDLIGMNLGYSILLEQDRWNLEFFGKGGPFLNDAKARSRFSITDPTSSSGINEASSFEVNNRETTLAFVGEFQLIGRYHLRPNLSLRAGWQMMYLTSLALAPDQLNFSPDEGRFPYTGDPFYHGAMFGFEGYW